MTSAAASAVLPVALDVSAVHPQSGGARTYLREVIRRLPASGIAPALFARRNDPGDWPGAAVLHRVSPSARPMRLLWEQVGLLRAVARRAPDVQVLHSPHYTLPVRVGGRSRAIRQVVTIHDLTVFTQPDRHERAKVALFRRAIRHAARHADALICVSERTARVLDRHVPVHAAVHVIPHGVDLELFRPTAEADDDEWLERLGVRTPYIVHVGAIEPRKNLEVLIRAHERLRRAGDDVQLVLAGAPWRGYDPVAVAAVGAAAASPPAIVRTGFVDDRAVAALLRQAAVAAYPSVEEGFGLPVVEALACGAVVVTTEDSVMADIAGSAAITTAPNDDEALAAALTVALRGDAPPVDARLAQASRFTWDESARAHGALYRDVASHAGH